MPPKVVKYKVKRTSYTIEFKREVINYAYKHDKSVAANHFNLNISMIRCWVQMNVSCWTTETNGKKNKIGSGKAEAENVLYSWIIEQ
ncbi:unnamed protein product [Rhizophagus irregularis]|nr:unnamed protein product [Rhizophagus irregularis]